MEKIKAWSVEARVNIKVMARTEHIARMAAESIIVGAMVVPLPHQVTFEITDIKEEI